MLANPRQLTVGRPLVSLALANSPGAVFAQLALPLPILHSQTVAQSLHELPHGEPALRSGLAPAGDGLQHAEVEARRWSLDASLHSDWELLSHGAHSRCGSSPQSLLHSGYNSDAEGGPMSGGGSSGGVAAAARAAAALAADAFRSARQRAEAEDTAASSALDLPPVPRPDADPQVAPAATAEAEPQPFGSLVLPAQGPLANVAAGAAVDLGPEPHGSASSSPRSSFEHTSSHASGHDLYSLSQVGAGWAGWACGPGWAVPGAEGCAPRKS